MPILDLENKKFGKLNARWPVGHSKRQRVMWLCNCECGKLVYLESSALTSGNHQSCGCSAFRFGSTHGLSRSREYKVYIEARRRCTKPAHIAFQYYGGRGIEFRFTSFEQFYKEVGPRPEGMTIDRINNDGHYEPGNVKWSTRKEQRANQRKAAYAVHKKGYKLT
jgi:hypothetical protein